MKGYKAILFDMDGTLLPMDMEAFTKGYFRLLAKKLLPFGIEKERLVPAIWEGTRAMVKNDGSETNDRAFWRRFCEVCGFSEAQIGAACLDFYINEFNEAKAFTGENPLAREAVRLARQKAPIVALATNPLFPMEGQATRMGWVGLKPCDFDLVTCYDTDRYCKPNPMYFTSVCERLKVKPDECLLIGNDENEDMRAGTEAGLDCLLVTDWMIEDKNHHWQGARGTFSEMVEMLRGLKQ